MTWVMENKNSTTGNRVAVINLKVLNETYDFLFLDCAFKELSRSYDFFRLGVLISFVGPRTNKLLYHLL